MNNNGKYFFIVVSLSKSTHHPTNQKPRYWARLFEPEAFHFSNPSSVAMIIMVGQLCLSVYKLIQNHLQSILCYNQQYKHHINSVPMEG